MMFREEYTGDFSRCRERERERERKGKSLSPSINPPPLYVFFSSS
jgi:hypothetical protein